MSPIQPKNTLQKPNNPNEQAWFSRHFSIVHYIAYPMEESYHDLRPYRSRFMKLREEKRLAIKRASVLAEAETPDSISAILSSRQRQQQQRPKVAKARLLPIENHKVGMRDWEIRSAVDMDKFTRRICNDSTKNKGFDASRGATMLGARPTATNVRRTQVKPVLRGIAWRDMLINASYVLACVVGAIYAHEIMAFGKHVNRELEKISKNTSKGEKSVGKSVR